MSHRPGPLLGTLPPLDLPPASFTSEGKLGSVSPRPSHTGKPTAAAVAAVHPPRLPSLSRGSPLRDDNRDGLFGSGEDEEDRDDDSSTSQPAAPPIESAMVIEDVVCHGHYQLAPRAARDALLRRAHEVPGSSQSGNSNRVPPAAAAAMYLSSSTPSAYISALSVSSCGQFAAYGDPSGGLYILPPAHAPPTTLYAEDTTAPYHGHSHTMASSPLGPARFDVRTVPPSSVSATAYLPYVDPLTSLEVGPKLTALCFVAGSTLSGPHARVLTANERIPKLFTVVRRRHVAAHRRDVVSTEGGCVLTFAPPFKAVDRLGTRVIGPLTSSVSWRNRGGGGGGGKGADDDDDDQGSDDDEGSDDAERESSKSNSAAWSPHPGYSCREDVKFGLEHEHNIHSIVSNEGDGGATFFSVDDLTVRLWSVEHNPLASLEVGSVKPTDSTDVSEALTSARMFPQAPNLLCLTSSAGTIRVVDLRASLSMQLLTAPAAGSHDGSRAAVTLTNPQRPGDGTFSAVTASVASCAMSADGRHVAGRDFVGVTLWDVRGGSGAGGDAVKSGGASASGLLPVARWNLHGHLHADFGAMYDSGLMFEKSGSQVAFLGGGCSGGEPQRLVTGTLTGDLAVMSVIGDAAAIWQCPSQTTNSGLPPPSDTAAGNGSDDGDADDAVGFMRETSFDAYIGGMAKPPGGAQPPAAPTCDPRAGGDSPLSVPNGAPTSTLRLVWLGRIASHDRYVTTTRHEGPMRRLPSTAMVASPYYFDPFDEAADASASPACDSLRSSAVPSTTVPGNRIGGVSPPPLLVRPRPTGGKSSLIGSANSTEGGERGPLPAGWRRRQRHVDGALSSGMSSAVSFCEGDASGGSGMANQTPQGYDRRVLHVASLPRGGGPNDVLVATRASLLTVRLSS